MKKIPEIRRTSDGLGPALFFLQSVKLVEFMPKILKKSTVLTLATG